jgi:CHAT domain-containing protein
MNQKPTYADLEIRILEQQDEGYPVEITLNNEQEFPRGVLTPDFLPWVPSASPADDGQRLFEWLFADDRLKTAWAEVRGRQPQRRIRLRIDASAPELHAIPWELLRDVGDGSAPQDLAAIEATPFSRYLAGRWQPGSPILKRPIKILVAIANPQNLADHNLTAIDVEAEWALLQEATAGLDVERVQLPQPCTLSALEAELKKGYHVLHFVGHGSYSEKREQAVLYLADGENQVELVSDADLAAMLARQLADADVQRDDKLRLVFLASCQTAARSPADAFRGFAPSLVAAGVPAVLAMQDLVPMDTAREFSTVFYRQLLQHGQVDRASNEARSALLTAKLPGAAIPALFMRLRSGLLFGQRGQILGNRAESFWNTLLDNIADGECTPFLGPGVTAGLLPSLEELSQTLAADYSYPFADSSNLPKVAQFIGTLDNRHLRKEVLRTLTTRFKKRLGLKSEPKDRKRGLAETIEAVNWSQLSQEILESEIHHQLADLDLPLYMTTNFDNFMALALRAKGHEPRRETIPWRESLQQDASRPHYDLDPPPTGEEPVVLHLFGTDDDLLSMVLTEDDYLDYLARISRDHEYLLPTSVNEALASTTLLFLGYRLEDLDLKVIMRGLLANLDLERWGMLHVAVQIEATTVDEAKQKEVIRYFQKYFSNSKIDVYWGTTHQFVADLHARWQEYQHG